MQEVRPFSDRSGMVLRIVHTQEPILEIHSVDYGVDFFYPFGECVFPRHRASSSSDLIQLLHIRRAGCRSRLPVGV